MDSQVSIPMISVCLASENRETVSPYYVITFWLFSYLQQFVQFVLWKFQSDSSRFPLISWICQWEGRFQNKFFGCCPEVSDKVLKVVPLKGKKMSLWLLPEHSWAHLAGSMNSFKKEKVFSFSRILECKKEGII